MNMKTLSPEDKITRILRAVSSPARFQILAAIGKGEACVCHLEALLGMRQAYISQQLMELRDADLLETRRDGRYIFYRLSEPQFLDMLLSIGKIFDISSKELESLIFPDPIPDCCCPNCEAAFQVSQTADAELES